MKLNKKSIRIAYWAVRITAISFALLLFSVTGIVATLTATHANGLISAHNAHLLDTPTDTPTATEYPSATPTPPPTPTPMPTPQSTAIIHPTSVMPLPTKAAATPPVNPRVTATSTVLGPLHATPTATAKTTPTATPVSTPTPNVPGIQIPTIPGNTHTTAHTSPTNKTTATITPFIRSIIGTSAIILLLAASMLVLALWKKGVFATLFIRGIPTPVPSSSIQNPSPAMNGQVAGASYSNYNALPTEAISAPSLAQSAIIPFGIQGIAQASPLLGAAPSAQLNTPVSPASANFKPLLPNYFPVNEAPGNQALATIAPEIDMISTKPTLQAASTQAPHTSGPVEAAFSTSQMHTPIPPSLQIMSLAYDFPPQDPFLETLMRQAQMGLFALPGKTS